MFLGLWRYLSGTLEIAIEGAQPETLVNLAVAEGLDLWHLRRRPGQVWGRIRASHFRHLRPLCRQARCRVRIRGRRGWPFLQRRIRRRPYLVGGCLLSALALAWVLGHIWEVEVRGTALMDPRAVQAELYHLGLRPGAWRFRLRPAELERRLTERVPEVGWASVRLEGVRAVVQVLERTAYRPPPDPGRVDLVSDRDSCVVETVVVFQGQRRVQEGEAVRLGQVLIEGGLYGFTSPPIRLPYVQEWPPTPDKPLGPRVARGQVVARCSYEGYLEVPLVREEPVPTGRRRWQLGLRWGSRDILLLGGPVPAAGYREASRRTAGFAGWRNWLPPVELDMVAYEEVRVHRVPVPEAEAVQAAVREYLARLTWQLQPGTGQVVGPPAVAVSTRTPEYLGVRIRLETREAIGRPQPAATGTPGTEEPNVGGHPDI